jgi:AraC-like DNA-binding protein/quercetin dioxygenase-like cupin family protein
MKPTLERIDPVFGNSFTIRKHTEICAEEKPNWHFHPEYEIVYISNGTGKRHICTHISEFQDGDLIFLGPNLPHLGFTQGLLEEHVEIVVQMKEDFLGHDFLQRPELHAIQQLFERSKQGLTFYGHTKWEVGRRLVRLVELSPFDRLIELLGILNQLAGSQEYKLLNVDGFALEVNMQDQERMRAVYDFVEQNYQQGIMLDDVASTVNMTTPAFCRYFKKMTTKTFTRFVNEFRIAHASRLLADDHYTIAAVSFECGFNNLSNFNKQFREVTGVSPSEYRKNHKRLLT